MPRSSNNVASRRRRRKVLKEAKGFRGRRKNLFRTAQESVNNANAYAYRDRRTSKRDFRRLWITRISAGVKSLGTSYSKFMGSLKAAGIEIDRKALSELAIHDFEAFRQLVDSTKATA